MNVVIGILIGWMIFTSTGRDTFWSVYTKLDMAGDLISAGIVKDMPANKEDPVKEEPAKKEPDLKREKYLVECKKVGFPKARCEQLWDQDDQKPMVSQVFGVKIVDIDQPEDNE